MKKILYFLSKEYREKVTKEKCEDIRNHLRNLDIQYNQYKRIEFTNNISLQKRTSFKVGMVFIILQFFVFGLFGYLLFRSSMRLNLSFTLFSWILIGFCFLFFILAIRSRKKEESKTICKIVLDANTLKLFFADGKEAEYPLDKIHVSSVASRDQDSNVSTTSFLFFVDEGNKEKKKKYYVDTYRVLNEYLAFYNYLGYVKKGCLYEEIDDETVLNMIEETTYGKKEDVALSRYKALLIMGYVFLFLIGACFLNVGMRLGHLIHLDKVEATVVQFEDWSHLDVDLQRVKDTHVVISYEYNDTKYEKILYNQDYFGKKVGKKKTIYVYPKYPESFDYFRLGLDEISIIAGFGVLAYICFFLYRKKVRELKVNQENEKKDFNE